MSKRRLAPFAFAAMVTFVPPAVAETTSSVKAGVLTCKLPPSIGFIIGSQQSMSCRYTANAPHPPETYTGTMDTIGLDIGVTAGGGLAWAVFAPTEGPPPGALGGLYVGASGDASFGVGGGANVLVGGSARTISLQPLSVEGEVGVNLALGVSGLTLAWVR
jgi:Protein of unknown function (DUF992)